jgi:hypothetical protein
MQLGMRVWPGLERLWYRGDFHALLVAILFGWILAFSFLATFVWPEWVTSYLGRNWVSVSVLPIVWISLLISALVTIATPSARLPATSPNNEEGALHAFVEAQEHYLQANYFEAEKRLRENLRVNAGDIESMLLLVAVLRRSRRLEEALDFISEMELLESSAPWFAELKTEKASCLRLKIQSLPPAHG